MTAANSTSPPPAAAETADGWFRPGRFAIMLAVLLVIPFFEVLSGEQTFFLRDFGYFTYPLAHHHRGSFWHGEFPLWNPLNCHGLPFLAQWNTLALYPGSLIYLLLPLPWSLNLYCLAHLFLGGLGMYFLAAHWTENRFAAAFAGVAYAFNGVTLNCLMWTNNIAALGWMPWVVLATHRAWREGGRAIAIAALLGALQMLSGAPEVILTTWGILTALMLGDLIRRKRSSSWLLEWKLPLRLVVIVLLVAGLAAAQLLPFLDFLPHSDRSKNAVATLDWPMPIWGWANFLVPLFRCHQTGAGVFFPHGQDWTSSYYFGAGVFVLALLAVWRARQKHVRLLGVLLGISLVLALGDAGFVYAWLRKLIPQFGLSRFTIKYVLVAAFCLPLLASFAVAQIRGLNEPAAIRRWRISAVALGGTAIAAIAFIVWWSYAHPLAGEHHSASWQHGLARALFLVAIAAGLFFLPRDPWTKSDRLARIGLLALIWLDVMTHAPSQNPAISTASLAPGVVREHWRQTTGQPAPEPGGPRAFTPKIAYDQFLKTMISDPSNDFLCHRLGLFADCNLLENIPIIDGFFSLYLREQRDVWSLLYFAPTNRDRSRLLDFAGVGHISSPTNVLAWQSRPTCLPLATGGQTPVFADANATFHALTSTDFDPRRVVCLPLDAATKITATNTAVVRVLNQKISAHQLEFEVEAERPALFVLSQSYYHPWHAYRDGEAVPIHRANHAFQAIELKAGRQKIRFNYEDKMFRLGMAISLLTLAGCLVMLVRMRKLSGAQNTPAIGGQL